MLSSFLISFHRQNFWGVMEQHHTAFTGWLFSHSDARVIFTLIIHSSLVTLHVAVFLSPQQQQQVKSIGFVDFFFQVQLKPKKQKEEKRRKKKKKKKEGSRSKQRHIFPWLWKVHLLTGCVCEDRAAKAQMLGLARKEASAKV